MDSNYLKFGDLVLLHVEAVYGYVSSQGQFVHFNYFSRFTNNNVFAQRDNNQSQVFTRNFRDFIFQILPKLNYDARKDYDTNLKIINRNKALSADAQKLGGTPKGLISPMTRGPSLMGQSSSKGKSSGSQGDQLQQMIRLQQEEQQFQKKMQHLLKKLNEEEEMNKKIIERKRGEQVAYGNEIQLKHIDSQSFLSAKKFCAEIDKSCNKVELQNHGSQSIFFKVMPRYKYRSEGEKVLYKDQVVLFNIKLNLYLHITERVLPIEKPLPLPRLANNPKEEITSKEPDRRTPPCDYVPMFEVNASTALSRFQVIPFSTFEEDDRMYIRGGSVIRLQHSEVGGYLASDDEDFTNDGMAEVFLWSYKKKFDDIESQNSACLFEIEIAQAENRGQICVQSQSQNSGGEEMLFRLRHLNTGRLVIDQEIEYEGEKILTLGLSNHLDLKADKTSQDGIELEDLYVDPHESSELESKSLFRLITTKVDPDGRIKAQTCVQIQHVRTRKFVCIKKKAQFLNKNKGKKNSNNLLMQPDADESVAISENVQHQQKQTHAFFQPIDDDEIYSGNRNIIELRSDASYENAFFIQLEEEDQLQNILFAHTSIGQLKKIVPLICYRDIEVGKEKMLKIQSILKQMADFVRVSEEGQFEDPDVIMTTFDNTADFNHKKTMIKKRQKILKELSMIEFIVQMLYYPFATKTFSLDATRCNDLIAQICAQAYNLMSSIVVEYDLNGLYASQWINLFFMQAMKTSHDNCIKAQNCINQLVSGNRKLLEIQITPKVIYQFIQICKTQNKHKRLIKLLKSLCSCEEQAVQNNQLDVIKYLLEDQETREQLMMPLSVSENRLQVKYILNKGMVDLQGLEKFSQRNDKGQIYKYFLALTELSAELCIGRNFKAYSQLLSIQPFQAIFQAVTDVQISTQIRSKFAKLLLNMHMDRESIDSLQIPALTLVWKDLQPYNEIKKKSPNGYLLQQQKQPIPSSLQPIKTFVLNHLNDANGVQNIFQKYENKLMIEILNIVKFMLKHGFYKDQEELNQVAIPLIPLLSGFDDNYKDQNNQSITGLPDNYLSTTRYNSTKQNEIILISKKLQCQILIYISQLEVDGKAQCFLSKFKNDYDQLFQSETPDQSKLFERINNDKRNSQNPLQKFKSKVINEPPPEQVEDPQEKLKCLSIELLKELSSIKGFEDQGEDMYVLILFDLLLYKYPALNKYAFELLMRYFTRIRTLMETAFNVQMLEFPQSIDVLNKVKFFQQELKSHIQEAEMWINKKDKHSQDIKTRLIQIFQVMTKQCLNNQVLDDDNKDQYSMVLSEKDDNFNTLTEEEEEYIIFMEINKMPNKENQRILRNLSIHELALFCIKYRVEQVASTNEIYINMIKQCYRFLIEFVRDNTENQLKLRDQLDAFLKDIDKYSLAVMLIYEIFKENKRFLNLNVSKIVKQIVTYQEEHEISSSKKGSLLKLLTVFCKYQDKLVRQNQIDIIVQMTKDVTRSKILYLFSKEGFNDLNELIQNCKDVEINESNMMMNQSLMQPQINISIEIFNLMTCLDLLSLCCEGKSDQAEIKCQTEILTLKNAVRILVQVESFWPFKTCLVNYITQCFLDSNQKELLAENDEANLKCIWDTATILLSDIENIIAAANNEDDIQLKFPSGEIQSHKDCGYQYFFDAVVKFFQQLLKRQSIEVRNNEKNVKKAIKLTSKIYYMCEDEDYKQKAYQLLSYIYHTEKYAKFLDHIKHPVVLEDNKNVQPVFQTKSFTSLKNKLKMYKTSKMNVNLMQVSMDYDLSQMIENEFENLVNWITGIEYNVKQMVRQNPTLDIKAFANLKFNQIMSSILKLLDSKQLDKDLHISGLKIIRKIVEVENKELNTPAADWDTDDWVNYKNMILIKQNALVDIGCIKFLCKHMSETDEEEILEECLLSCITLLLGGNAKTQEAFHKYLQEKDEHNKVLLKIKKMLVQQFETVKHFLGEKSSKLQMLAKNHERQLEKEKDKEKQQSVKKQSFSRKELGPENKKMSSTVYNSANNSVHDFNETEDNLLTLDDSMQLGMSTEKDYKKNAKDEDEAYLITQTKQQSINKCMRILRFLQLLTENHYTLMQNLLRQQTMINGVANPKSYDFVSYVSFMLGAYEKSLVNCYSCSLGYQMIETLTEFIQGPCKENQRALVSAKVIDNCRDLISHGAQSEKELRNQGFIGEKIQLLDGLQMKAVRLLLSIIEGPKDYQIIRNITISLDDFVIVFERMQHVYEQFVMNELQLPKSVTLEQVNEALKKDSFDNSILEAFDLYMLVNQLADSYQPAKEKVQLFANTTSYKFLNHHTGNIEVLIEQQLQRVYFPVKPVCNYLSLQSKDLLMQNVDRQSPQHKILGLLKVVPDLIDEMEHVESLSRSRFQALTPDRLSTLKDISTITSFIISGIMIAFYEYTDIYDEVTSTSQFLPHINQWADLTIHCLGYAQIGIVTIILFGWFINKGNLLIQSQWRAYNERNKLKYAGYLKNKKENQHGFIQKRVADLSLYEARILLQTHGPDAEEFMSEDGQRNLYYCILKMEYSWISFMFVILSGPFTSSLVQIALAVLGIFQSRLFFCFGLLNVISVALNSNQLLLTAVLGLVIIYIYSIIGFQFLSPVYFNQDIVVKSLGEKGDSICQELLHCFITTFNYGLRAGGGIGDMIAPLSYENDPRDMYFFKIIFDLTFFLIVIVILLNIIFGIIIDTFAELRDKKHNIDEDMKNICFICNINRQTFDRDSIEGFDFHMISEHNIWQYLYFIIHLKTKDETDFNGTESYIAEKFLKEDISWFPLHKALSLTKETHVFSNKSQEEEDNKEPQKGTFQYVNLKLKQCDDVLNNLEGFL